MIIIKELVVRAYVIPENAQNGASLTAAQSNNAAAANMNEESRAMLIEDCVRQVLEILEREKER